MIRFEFPIEPQAQGRPRGRIRAGQGKSFVQFYDPKNSRTYKESLVAMAKARMGAREPLDGPLVVKLRFYIKPPKNIATSIKKMAEVDLGILRPIVKPDVDNFVKGTLDAMNKVVWHDDARIVKLTAEKFYSNEPRTEMEVYQYKDNLMFV